MNDFLRDRAKIWNERLAELMQNNIYERKFTQATLAVEMNRRYAEKRGAHFTQKGVGRWLKVGESRSQEGEYGFPEYETMLYIADFFFVDVGYLTGETDFKRFDIERASSFLGISEKTTEQIMRITQAESRRPSPFVLVNRMAFDHLISSDDFFELVVRLRSMYNTSPISGVPDHNKQDHLEAASGYADDVNESLSLSRFQSYETFFRLLDNLYPYAKTTDFLIPDEDDED